MLVSILIPVYNAERYLGECLGSVLQQTFSQLQIVALNDGSTDNSAAILDRYALQDNRLTVIHRQHRAIAATRLELLARAEGEYVGFVDADDLIQPDMVAEMLKICEDNQLDMAVCCNTHDTTLTPRTATSGSPEILSREEALREYLKHRRLNGSLCNKLIRRECCRGAECPEEVQFGEDAVICWQILRNVNRIGFTDGKFYHYRKNIDSVSYQPVSQKKMSERIAWNFICNDVARHSPELLPMAEAQRGFLSLMLLFDIARLGCSDSQYRKTLMADIARDYRAMKQSGFVSKNKIVFYRFSRLCWPLAKLAVKILY